MSFKSFEAVKEFLELGVKQECIVHLKGFPQIPSSSNKVTVIIGEYSNSIYNVNINWEDEPYNLEDYKDYGLFGYYSTKFSDMDYDSMSNSLTINDKNGRKIILTY